MPRDDWFRKTTWSEEDEAAFFMRLQQTRGPTESARCLRIQAYTLARTREAGLVRAALGLLAVLQTRFPDPDELAPAHLLAAQCHDQLGEIELALQHFRHAIRAEEHNRGFDPGSSVELAWFIASRGLSHLYDEAERALGRTHPDTPLARFKAAAVRARIAESRGDLPAAAEAAREVLAAAAKRRSRFRIRGTHGIVGPEYAPVVEQLVLLARAG